MWTPEHRRAADRRGLRYPSDLTDAEWALVEPLIPPAKRGGRPRDVNVREVLNGIFYVLSTGCQWQALPKDLPPKSTVHYYFMLWEWDGTLERIHHALYVAVRDAKDARPARPRRSSTAKAPSRVKGGSRSTRRATMRARRSRAASATSWSTRSASCDVVVHPGRRARSRRRGLCYEGARAACSLHRAIFGDGGYQGARMAAAVARTGTWTIEIVKRCERTASWCCPSAGSSSARLPGSAAIDVWRATSSATRATSRPSSASP